MPKYQDIQKGRTRLHPKIWLRVLDRPELHNLRQFGAVAPSTDLIWAYRYCYYVIKLPVVSDAVYDAAKAEEMEFGPGSPILSMPASDRVIDYPVHIGELALYMVYKKYWEGKIDHNLAKQRLPPREDARTRPSH